MYETQLLEQQIVGPGSRFRLFGLGFDGCIGAVHELRAIVNLLGGAAPAADPWWHRSATSRYCCRAKEKAAPASSRRRGGDIRAKLQRDQARIELTRGEQLFVSADAHQPTSIDHRDAVDAANGRETM